MSALEEKARSSTANRSPRRTIIFVREKAGSYLLGICEVAAKPVKYVLAHFIVAIVILVCSQGMKVLMNYVDYSQEKVYRVITVRDVVNKLEITWLVIIFISAMIEAIVKLRER